MTATIDEILPWGRSYDEYMAMFALTPADLAKSIVGCGDGPAAFNAGMRAHGRRSISVDPIYAFTAAQIRDRISVATPMIVANTRQHMDAYRWDTIPSIEALVEMRQAAMARFLEDYDQGIAEGRYLAGVLPSLPLPDASCDLALCSHLLFTYSEKLSAADHVAFIREIARVAAEIRVFPLLDMNGAASPHLGAVLDALPDLGLRGEVREVSYEFQRGGNRMLQIARS